MSAQATMSNEWYAKFCQLAAANVLDRNQHLRFDYTTLKRARDMGALRHDNAIPADIVTLFQNVYKTTCQMAGDFVPDEKQQNVLLQVLLNIHVGYQLITGDIMYTTFSQG